MEPDYRRKHRDTTVEAIFLIVFGVFLMIFSGYGLYAMVKEKYKLLNGYGMSMLALFILGAFIGFAMKSIYLQGIDEFEVIFEDYDEDERVRSMIDEMQEKMHCCGWTGHGDFEKEVQEGKLPDSCCEKNSTLPCTPQGRYFKEGCAEKVIEIKSDMSTLSYIIVLASIIPLISALVSFFVVSRIKNEPPELETEIPQSV